ncbi:hypothetical protein GCM10023116_01650 [Kistimonas scapharcae]|uniref:Uncharacterized protein n=1 Tax=Kistimonas scapharcae TaxID=1036133 RepID=A0ABP8UXH4_9GAMM
MITYEPSKEDVAKFYASQPKTKGVEQESFAQAADRMMRREMKKLYGRSKYRPDGGLYTSDERPWLFGE